MSSDGLSDFNGILYMFYASMAIKGPFPGGNVGQKSGILVIFAIFCIFRYVFITIFVDLHENFSDFR